MFSIVPSYCPHPVYSKAGMSDIFTNLMQKSSNRLSFLLKKYEYLFFINFLTLQFQIFVSKKWGFTKFERDQYEEMRANGRLQPDGSHVKYLPEHGPLSAWCKVQAELAGI